MKELILKNRIREYRTQSKMTQDELASMCNVSRQTIIAIEKGTFCPTAKLAYFICIALNRTFEELFYIEEE